MVDAGRACGAKLKGEGYCVRRPILNQGMHGRRPPYRCAAHGGVVLGASGMLESKYGLVATMLLPGEGMVADALDAVGLDNEIKIVRLRLQRAVVAESEALEAESEGLGLPGTVEQFGERIQQITGQLARLVAAREIERRDGVDDDDVDVGRVREQMEAMLASFTAGKPRA